MAYYKEQMDAELPKSEWGEWKTLFVVGALLPLPLPRCLPCIDDNDYTYAKVNTLFSLIFYYY